MGRTAVASHLVANQLRTYAEEKQFVFGLLIGQPNTDSKDYIIYVARTPKCPSEEDGKDKATPANSIERIDSQLLVNHAVTVTRMIPGCFYVQGIFVVSEANIFQNDEAAKKVRQIVFDINKILSDNTIFRSNTTKFDNGEKLVLHCTFDSIFTCRSMNTAEISGSLKPADWKVFDNPVTWYLFETNYDVEEVFPVLVRDSTLNLEQNFLLSLKTLNDYLENSTIFIQHEKQDGNLTLETFLKMKRQKQDRSTKFKSTVFFPTSIGRVESSRIVSVNGTIRYSGIVHSRIWAHPKTTFDDIQHYIRNDILRSLASRVQIFCDGLTEPNIQEGTFIVSEPPRRVFLKVAGTGGIEFSEYLFRGELPDVVAEQAKEMLDLKIGVEDIDTELESLPSYEEDTSSFSDDSLTGSDKKVNRSEVRKNMFLAGIIGAVAILIVSLIFQFVLR